MTETEKKRAARIQSSHQSQNGTFVNPNRVSSKLFSQETWNVTKEYIFGKRTDPKPQIDLPVHRLNLHQWRNHEERQLSFSWIGHSSILISMEYVNF